MGGGECSYLYTSHRTCGVHVGNIAIILDTAPRVSNNIYFGKHWEPYSQVPIFMQLCYDLYFLATETAQTGKFGYSAAASTVIGNSKNKAKAISAKL